MSTSQNRINGNRLKYAKSTYLKQHSDNPVHWQLWDRQALDLSLLYDKPILLSIGYSACHWCHVMAHECFEDQEVADLMNRHFINIKVDREERPDIDQIYMSALNAMGEQGGWPLTIFLSPQGDAFWGGTYFPKYSNGHLPGFIDILKSLAHLWREDRNRIEGNIAALKDHLHHIFQPEAEQLPNQEALFQNYANAIAQHIDKKLGGINGQPKFPNFPLMAMLWASYKISEHAEHRDLFLLSTEKMLNGGIYDHLAGGLARYSTDQFWLVPHFEKMLYDNAQTIRQCLWAYGATQNELFRIRIEEIFSWLMSEMALPQGGFASGLDADSEGIEGKFYLWQQREIETVLGNDADEFMRSYNVTERGNWPEGGTGANILHRSDMHYFNRIKDTDLKPLREKLLFERNKRIRPGRDAKCLTDWNAYLIRALAEAARCFQRQDWLDYAKACYQYLMKGNEQQFSHCISEGDTNLPALSSDYAALINAALSLYQAEPLAEYRAAYIDDARKILAALDQSHKDQNDDYRLTALDSDDVIFYLYGDQDEAIPSSTSQIIEALMRLALISDDEVLLKRTNALAERALGRCQMVNYGQAGILTAAVQLLDPVKLVLIISDSDDDLALCAARLPDPCRTDVILSYQEALQQPQWVGLLNASQNRSCAILCRNNVCLPPVYHSEDLEKLL